jgi:hypothetical protein
MSRRGKEEGKERTWQRQNRILARRRISSLRKERQGTLPKTLPINLPIARLSTITKAILHLRLNLRRAESGNATRRQSDVYVYRLYNKESNPVEDVVAMHGFRRHREPSHDR